MIITAHQPNYLPWPGLFHKIALADMHVVYDDVDYAKYGYSNRNYIRGRNGVILLTVPVCSPDQRTHKLNEIVIDASNERWRRKHWHSIANCYSRAPFFLDYCDRISEIYKRSWLRLVDLNIYILEMFLDLFGIKRPIIRASALGITGQKTNRVIDLCQKIGATSFIFGSGGRKYADLEELRRANIEPLFQSYRIPNYATNYPPVASPLSAIDLLFHCGSESLKVLMQNQPTLKDLRAAVKDDE